MKDFTPRPYQAYAIKKIVNLPAVGLLLDMGLGKTVITLSAINELINDRLEVDRVLVIAPLRVAETTWPDEIKEWSHLRHLTISVVTGTAQQCVKALKRPADIYVINRERTSWLVELYGRSWPFDMVVIDESSSFKSPQSKRFKDLRKVRPLIKRIVELTGTPTPNGLMDLWSQIYLLDMGARLGRTITWYRREFFRPGRGNGFVTYEWRLVEDGEKQIYKRIDDICVSMKSDDYLKLPDIIYNEVSVDLGKQAMSRYKELERNLVLALKNTEIAVTSAAALSNKLLQLANGSIYDEAGNSVTLHTAKIKALQDIAETNEHKNLLVMYWYKHDRDLLLKHFPEAVALRNAEDIRRWNAGRIRILLLHPASAAHGINLQKGGHIAIWYGLTWSLELYQQANKRLHRSGQSHNVIVHHLVAKGTIDEDVMMALKAKAEGQNRMLEAVKARIKAYAGK